MTFRVPVCLVEVLLGEAGQLRQVVLLTEPAVVGEATLVGAKTDTETLLVAGSLLFDVQPKFVVGRTVAVMEIVWIIVLLMTVM